MRLAGSAKTLGQTRAIISCLLTNSPAFQQNKQEFQGATSERHGLVAFQQRELLSKQAKRPERNFGRRDACRFGSFREESVAGIRALKVASHGKCWIGMKLCQRWPLGPG